MRHFVLALAAFSLVASAQEDPLSWFPLQVGSFWVYAHEWKSGDRNHPDIDRWTSEERITGWLRIPEGIVVLRGANQRIDPNQQTRTHRVISPKGEARYEQDQGSSHAHLITRAKDPYLVHLNCIYTLSDGWDAQRKDLRPEYRRYLNEASVSPDFCFPLQIGREWGNNDIPWRVEPAREGSHTFLPAEYPEAIHVFSNHFGSGGLEHVWFQKGVGVVGEHYIHNGTYDEYVKKLVSFSPSGKDVSPVRK
jgi:hypothetical protein